MEIRVELQLGVLTINELLSCSIKLKKIQSIVGSYVNIECSDAAIASYITSLIGNMNKVIIVNGVVVKSFDSAYSIGELVGWFKDYKVIKLD